MDNNLAFDFLTDNENKTITIKREYAAGISLVWKAYTNAAMLDKWWAPKPWKAHTKIMDFTKGGKWLYAMVGPAGEEHWSLAQYTTVEFEKRFVGIDAFTDEGGNINEEMPKSNWDVHFTAQGDKTLVQFTIWFDTVAQLEAILNMGFKEGLSSAMENLDELLLSLKK